MRKTAVWLAVLALRLPAQSMIPAKAGLISYADDAYVDGRAVEVSRTRFVPMNENEVLRTGRGRAELLLGPCSAMWVDVRSSLRMVASALSDVRVEVLTGSVLVATGDMLKGTRVSVLLKAFPAALDPKGAYRFDADPARIKTLAGKAIVQWKSEPVTLSAGRLLLLDADGGAGRFDRKSTDTFENWSVGRAEYLSDLSGQRKEPGLRASAPTSPAGRGSPVPVPGQIPAVPPLEPLPPPSACGVSAW